MNSASTTHCTHTPRTSPQALGPGPEQGAHLILSCPCGVSLTSQNLCHILRNAWAAGAGTLFFFLRCRLKDTICIGSRVILGRHDVSIQIPDGPGGLEHPTNHNNSMLGRAAHFSRQRVWVGGGRACANVCVITNVSLELLHFARGPTRERIFSHAD